MATLVIHYLDALGPVSVRLLNERGGIVVSSRPLSSAQPTLEVPELQAGIYILVATEATGGEEARRIVVEAGVEQIDYTLGSPSGRWAGGGYYGGAPSRLPSPGARFGYLETKTINDNLLVPEERTPAEVAFSDNSRRALQAIVRADRSTSSPKSDPSLFSREYRPGLKSIGFEPDSSPFGRFGSLRRWVWHDRWREVPIGSPAGAESVRTRRTADEFIVAIGSPLLPQALAITNLGGAGPVVIVPPFRGGLDVSFLAVGLEAAGAADRVANPSALRVPVAAVRPWEQGVGDLLAGLSAAALPGASELLQAQFDAAGDHSTEEALERLLHKNDDPAAAVLAAHYLLRYAADKLPTRWLQNLGARLPMVADAPTILAWRYITAGAGDDLPIGAEEVRDLFREASRRPVTLFGRARSLLSQGQRLYGPWTRSRRLDIASPRSLRAGDYLDVGADAGGLEAFWGTSPSAPLGTGRTGRTVWSGSGTDVELVDGRFQ